MTYILKPSGCSKSSKKPLRGGDKTPLLEINYEWILWAKWTSKENCNGSVADDPWLCFERWDKNAIYVKILTWMLFELCEYKFGLVYVFKILTEFAVTTLWMDSTDIVRAINTPPPKKKEEEILVSNKYYIYSLKWNCHNLFPKFH